MITSSDNAVAQHQKVMNELWERALQHVPTGVNRDSQGAPQERV
jgi:hypothetical protein